MKDRKRPDFIFVLDMGAPGRPGNEHKAFSILSALGAARASRASIDEDVLPAAGNILESMEIMEARWARGDYSLENIIYWVFPESAFYLRHCERMGVEPGDYLAGILTRARDLNARYGAWRVTVQIRGELDSCFIDFPGDWSTRARCYANWEAFNNTELHHHRYKRYGSKACYGDLPEAYPVKDFHDFLARRGMRLKDYPVDVCCNRGFDVHHNFRWGWPSVSVELFCGSTWNAHLLIAFCRGAAKEYGGRWGCDISPWGDGITPLETTYHRDGRWMGGLSASLLLRAWMICIMSGAHYVLSEVTERTHLVVDTEIKPVPDGWGGHARKRNITGEQDLSPAGRNNIILSRYIFERHPDRGVAYAPVALVLHSANGWNAACMIGADDVTPSPPDPHIAPYQVWFGKLVSTPAEWMIGAFFRCAFASEPAMGNRMDIQRRIGNADLLEQIRLGRIRPEEFAELRSDFSKTPGKTHFLP